LQHDVSNLAALPSRTRAFLEHGAPEGQRNREAFEAAAQLRDAGIVEGDALALVETGAARCGLATNEARGAVKSAYRKPAREPIVTTRNGGNNGKRHVVARYDYTDAAGVLLYQVERTDPKGFRQRRPDGKGGWHYNLEGVARTLYRLPKLANAAEVWIAEGERDVETLEGLGLVATTNSGGAGNWPKDHATHFHGKHVVIIPDADAPGRDHADQVARALHGVAEKVRVLRLPEGVKDVSELAATYSDTGELTERLSLLAEGAAEWRPKPDADPTHEADAAPEAGTAIVRLLAEFRVASDLTTDPRNLLGRRFLCRGGALLLAGPTGIGKSSLLLQAAITFALGRPLFGIAPAGKLRTLLIQAENDDGDVAEMRDGVYRGLGLTDQEQADAGAAVQVVCESVATGGQFIGLAGELIAEHRPDLFLIDPLFAYCGCNVSDQEAMSGFLRNGLNPLLQAHGCGLILACHTNKPASGREKPDWKAGDFAYLASGSAELANWARAVVGIRSIGAHSVFEIVLGKRGKRAGLVTADGDPRYSFFIKHAAAGICWELATDADLEGDGKPKPGKPELLRLIPKLGCIGQAALLNEAGAIGVGKNRCRDLLAELVECTALYQWRTPRPGTRDAISYSLQPQDKGAA